MPLALVFLTGIGGCKGADHNGARDSTAMSAEQADTAAKTSAPAAAPKAGMSDANIVALLDEANKADSSSGAVALKKATRPDVKNFAKLMMSEHHALRAQGQALAKQLGVEPKAPERDPLAPYAASEAKQLQSTPKGAEFDRTYIQKEIVTHQAVRDFAEQARRSTPSGDIRSFIDLMTPVIRRHLDRAGRRS